jgi:hypothetical protein
MHRLMGDLQNRSGRAVVLGLLLLGIGTACTADPITGINAAGDGRSTEFPPTQVRWTEDDVWAAMADRLPGGFAGFYSIEGELIVASADPARGGDLVAELMRNSRIRGRAAARPIRVQPVQFTFRELKDWFDALVAVIDGNSFIFLDIDEVRNDIAVGIAEPSQRAAVMAAARLAGIPPRAIRIVETGPIMPDQTLQDFVRPLVGGLEILPSGCTLSFNVQHHEFGQSFATAAHCTPRMGWVDGVAAYQGGWSDFIGVEVYDEPVYTGGNCPSGRVCRRADVALFRTDPPVPVSQGRIARPIAFGTTVIGADPPFEIWSDIEAGCWFGSCFPYVVGDVMHKVGAATGWTFGTISHTCVLVNFPSWVQPGNVSLPCQKGAGYHSAGGDSGAPVMKWSDDSNQMVLAGIHHSTSATGVRYFSGIGDVRRDLKPAWVTSGCAIRLTVPGSFWC